jgi:hypothetical protein
MMVSAREKRYSRIKQRVLGMQTVTYTRSYLSKYWRQCPGKPTNLLKNSMAAEGKRHV